MRWQAYVDFQLFSQKSSGIPVMYICVCVRMPMCIFKVVVAVLILVMKVMPFICVCVQIVETCCKQSCLNNSENAWVPVML